MIAVTSAIYTVARFGHAAATTDEMRTVTGADPTTFKDWALEHAHVWARPRSHHLADDDTGSI